MSQDKKSSKKTATENFVEMFNTFADAVSEIFDDPKLKKQAKDFAKSAAESGKTLGSRFKDEEVKSKFKDVGKAAQDFGKSVADCFKSDKDN